MSSAPPSDVFLLPLESGLADTNSGERFPGEGMPDRMVFPFSSDRLTPQGAGSTRQIKSPTWFVGDEANDLLRVLGDLTQLDFVSGPVVLYGPSQTGKSVLADALAKRWARNLFFRRRLAAEQPTDQTDPPQLENEPLRLSRSKAICLAAFDWSLQLQEALDTNSLPSFHKRFLQAGAVMIDDLQQLHNSPFSQGQLVQLIDRLDAAGVPFVCTLNQAPQELAGLRSDLTSRLLGGLVLPVSFPGQGAREKLAQDWARELELDFSPAGMQWLLNLPQTLSYSGLLGTLRTLHAVSSAKSIRWEPAELQAQLCVPPDEAKLTWPELIIAAVAEHFELSVELLRGPSRRQTPVLARGLAMTLIRTLCNCSLAELGSLFANRDHSTVLNALESTEKRFTNDEHFRAATCRLLTKLQQMASLQRLPFPSETLPSWLRSADHPAGD